MKRSNLFLAILIVLMSGLFYNCSGGDAVTNQGGSGKSNQEVCGNGICGNGETQENCPADCPAPQPVCGNSVCENGETHQNCPVDCPAPQPVCGNDICENGETQENCPKDCGCVDANKNGICDNAEYIGIYCYSQAELDTAFGDTTYLGQFSFPALTVTGWDAQNGVIGFIQHGDTICFTLPKPLPMVDHGYEFLFFDATAGEQEWNLWVANLVAPKTIEVLVGNTITSRPILPYFSNRGYIACLDEETPLCWENLCTRNKAGTQTCYDGAKIDNTCGIVDKTGAYINKCETCVEHCKNIADIIAP